MVPLIAALVVYVAIGVGLIRLSMWLTKRIAAPAIRIAFHTAVFTLWFMPGFSASEGGAMPGPLWLIALNSQKDTDLLSVAEAFVVCWLVVWAVAFCGNWLFRPLEEKKSTEDEHNRLP